MVRSWRRRYSRSPSDTQLAAFRSAVLRYERDEVISLKQANWRSTVQTEMPRIDEVIEEISNEDRYQVEDVLTEADADPGGKWEQYIANKYATEHAGIAACDRVVLSLDLQRMLYKKRYEIHGEWSDETPFYDSDGDEILELKVIRPTQRRPRLGRSTSTTESGSDATSSSKDCEDTHDEHKVSSDYKADAKTQCKEVDENPPCQSFFDISDEENSSEASNGQDVTENPSSLSSGTSNEISQEQAMQTAIEQLFSNFPACIVSVFQISEEHGEYGASSLTQAQHWIAVKRDQLPRLFQVWVADWTTQNYVPVAAMSNSTSQTVPFSSHLWLIVTHTDKIVVNNLTLDTWFKTHAAKPSLQAATPNPSMQYDFVRPVVQEMTAGKKRKLEEMTDKVSKESSNTVLRSIDHTQKQQPQEETEEQNRYLRHPRHAYLSRRRRLRRHESQCSMEPDANNLGPQIILTKPNGLSFYLISPDVSAAPQLD